MIRALTATLLAALAFCANAQAPTASDVTRAALAAGYKASFVCSGLFNAGQDLRVVTANDLSGAYPDLREALAALPEPQIDTTGKVIAVSFDPNLPPRYAVWRAGFGCTQLPIGASLDASAWLPRFDGFKAPDGRELSSTLSPAADPAATRLSLYGTFDPPVEFAFDGATYGVGTRTSAVLVVHRGQVLAEQYGRGIDAQTPQRTWSVAKTLTALLIGAGVQKGQIGLDNPGVIAAWNSGADPRRAITLRHLLTMSSGLESSGSRTDRLYFGGATVLDTASRASLEAVPGTRFKYSNNDTVIAMRALREALKDDAAYWNAPYELLWAIGANNTVFEMDWQGDYISSSQVWTTARDLARVGLLLLQDGRWGDRQLLPMDWHQTLTTPAAAQPRDGEFGYGLQVWLMNRSPGVPEDAFAALGNRGQHLVIIPSLDLVIVRRGFDEIGGTGFDIAGFTADIVAALEIAKQLDIEDLLMNLGTRPPRDMEVPITIIEDDSVLRRPADRDTSEAEPSGAQ
jgi:CubicO group peptidase (beta-lactamase class C family)